MHIWNKDNGENTDSAEDNIIYIKLGQALVLATTISSVLPSKALRDQGPSLPPLTHQWSRPLVHSCTQAFICCSFCWEGSFSSICMAHSFNFLQVCIQMTPAHWVLTWSPISISTTYCPFCTVFFLSTYHHLPFTLLISPHKLSPIKEETVLFTSASLEPGTVFGTYLALNVNEWMNGCIMNYFSLIFIILLPILKWKPTPRKKVYRFWQKDLKGVNVKK